MTERLSSHPSTGHGSFTELAQRQKAHIDAAMLEPGLYLVATPIGTARDITLRALDVLNSAEVLAAEDTRVMRHLMDIHGIPLRGRYILAYHDHNADRQRPKIMAALNEGRSVAYASDAGTPLVADPGYRLAKDASAENIRVHAIPGPSAVLTALCLSGLPSDRFLFAGFPPSGKSARADWLAQWSGVDATVILFESPRRVHQTLMELCETDATRPVVVARELTKKFEEVIRGTAEELAADPHIKALKGEVVLMLAPPAPKPVSEDQLLTALRKKMRQMSLKDAVREVADDLALPRRDVYQTAIGLSNETTK